MKTKQTFLYGMLAVIFALTFNALSLTGCESPTNGGGGGGTGAGTGGGGGGGDGGGTGNKPRAVTDVILDRTELILAVGKTETLTATVAPEDAANKAVSWKSSDTGVATVADGLVTAKAEGTATITVTTADGGKTATCALTVDNRPLGKWYSNNGQYRPYTLTITAGTIRWEDENGTFVQYANVVWTKADNTNTANKTNYPNGYTVTGDRSSSPSGGYYNTNFGFVAMSADGKSVYLGTDAATAFNSNSSGSIYAKALTYTAVSNSATGTTAINFTFSAAVTGLTADDITITDGSGSATKGALSGTGNGTRWTLTVTWVTAGNITVSIDRYNIENAPKTVTVYQESNITYTAVSNRTTGTSAINFTFSAAVSGLTADAIAITGGSGTATKGALTGSGTTWSLGVTNVTTGDVTVAIGHGEIESAPKTVAVYEITMIPLTENVWADGSIPTDGEQWFVFTATASTQYIHFSTSGTLKNVYVQVYTSSVATVGSETNLFSSITRISRPLSSGQTYYIRVRAYQSNSGGTYKIGFGSIVPLDYHPLRLTANQWSKDHPIARNSERWFVFTATASTQYIHCVPTNTNSVYVQVYDNSGATVGDKTIMDSSNTSYISRSLTSGQTYYIRVELLSISNNETHFDIVFNTSSTKPQK